MIYCTLIYGEQWHKKYSHTIIKESKNCDIYILSNLPEYFSDCKYVEKYKRPVFSYYEKLNWVLKLTKRLKQRVTYVDTNYLINLNKHPLTDNDSVYTNLLSNIDNKSFNSLGRDELRTLFNNADYPWQDSEYMTEKIISVPYLPNTTDKLINDIKYLQPHFEKVYCGNIKGSFKFKQYAKAGIGYVEGAALLAVLNKHNIKYTCVPNLFRHRDQLM